MRKKILSLLLILASLAAMAVPVLASGAPAAGQAGGYAFTTAAVSSTDTDPGAASSTDIKDGVAKAGNGKFYYYKNGKILKGGWITNSATGRQYYAAADGLLYTGFRTIGSKSYYFSVNDAHMMRSGVVTGPKGLKYYVAKDGHAMKNGPITGPNNKRYVAGTRWTKTASWCGASGSRWAASGITSRPTAPWPGTSTWTATTWALTAPAPPGAPAGLAAQAVQAAAPAGRSPIRTPPPCM